MQFFLDLIKTKVNKNNIKKYQKLTKEINNLVEVLKTNVFADGLSKEKIQEELLKLRNDTSSNSTNKTKRAIALAKIAAGEVLGMPYFDVQIQGALALTDGNIAEMKTGEGKTLTCTAAVAANFVLGQKTHVVTSNEYLAVRDLELLRPLYEYLGIKCAYNISKMNKTEKLEAYSSDVLYSVASELGFDYLRDNLVYKYSDKVQTFDFGNTKALIDEADSILIDECTTPLIISSQIPDATGGRHAIIIEMIEKMDKMAKEPHPSPLVEEYIPGDFWLDEKIKKVHLSDEGYVKLESLAVEYELIPSAQELYLRKNAWLLREVCNALAAKYLYIKDREYIVKGDEIIIIDSNTGRIADGRNWGDGLHQAIEAKEGLTIKPETASGGKISIQNYFLMYSQISGMSGTIMTSSEEFEFIYNSATIAIPKNKPEKRIDLDDRLFLTSKEKYEAVIKEVVERRKNNQPILIGTVSVKESELLSNLLTEAQIPHSVLNAKNHHYEAQIIAQAGKPGNVTVSTSMAGRGTDIILGGNKEALMDILDDQIKVIHERRDTLNQMYHAGYQFTIDYLTNSYNEQLALIQQIKEQEKLDNPANVIENVDNKVLLEDILQKNNVLKEYLNNNIKEIIELRNKQAEDHNMNLARQEIGEEATNEQLLAHIEKRKAEILAAQEEQELEEDDILAQIASKKQTTEEIQAEAVATEKEATDSKLLVEEFKKEVEQEAIAEGILEENVEPLKTETLPENTVLSENILPESLIEKINSNKKPEIKIGHIIQSWKFHDDFLNQASEYKKEIWENSGMKQPLSITPNNFNISDRNEDATTSETVDHQLVAPTLLALYSQSFYNYLIHDGQAFLNRVLNVLENTVNKERELLNKEYSKWKQQVLDAGGLCVIGSSRNHTRRIDNQLIGRSGRQGDKGTSIFFMSMEDEWFEVFVKSSEVTYNFLKNQLIKNQKNYQETMKLDTSKIKDCPVNYLSYPGLSKSLGIIQKKNEDAQYASRKNTFQFDAAASDVRKGFLNIRNSILENPSSVKDRLKFALHDALKPICHDGFFEHLSDKLKIEGSTIESIMQGVYDMPINGMLDYANLYLEDPDNSYVPNVLAANREIDVKVQEKIYGIIDKRIEELEEQEYLEISSMILQSLDQQWVTALNVMEEMNYSVGLRQIAQKNPIYEFKNICYEIFEDIIKHFNENLIEHYNHILDIRKHSEILKQTMLEEDNDIVEASEFAPKEISNEISIEALEANSESISLDEYKENYLNKFSTITQEHQETEKA